MNSEQITKVQINDFPAVWEIVTGCIRSLQDSDLDQWGDFYPTQEVIRADIEKSEMHMLCRGDECLGIITLNEKQEPEYDLLTWRYRQAPALVVHRLMAVWHSHRKGIGTRLMTFAETFAKENGYRCILLDAYTANPAAIGLYQTLGYTPAGHVRFPRRQHPFMCFEKLISNSNTQQGIPHVHYR